MAESKAVLPSTQRDYYLGSGPVSSLRLNFQHYLWRDALGYNLHPTIPTDAENLRIADVATGTAVWLCDLSDHLPASATLDGFDATAAKFPHPESLPANVTLRVLDATQPPPPELRGRYDVVNVRLVLAVVQDADPSPVLRHCMDLLKPGGYLQWAELCTDNVDIVAPHPDDGAATSAQDRLKGIFMGTKDYSWISKLPSIFKDYGLAVLTADRVLAKKWQRHQLLDSMVVLMDEMATTVLDKRPESGKGDELRQLAQDSHAEISKSGLYFKSAMRVVVGRKGS